ncbi:MAG TPA: Hsp70 family protein [Acidimicrobiales bacterium]|nr:Hsp70 family protein [Acidimicrobiales bacterium]
MADWTLAIDFGTTYTCAVMRFGEETEVVLVNGETRMPSAVLSDPTGNLVVGKLAELQAPSMPDRLERNPKRRLGDGIFLLGGEPVQVIKAVSEVMKAVADEATRSRGGQVPSAIRLTHPARWAIDGVYVRTMAEAAALARLPDPTFVSEPVAAARFFARHEIEPGTPLAVYDLGGGTFDTTVLVRREEGFQLLGRPGGIPDLGGEDFDEGVFQILGSQLDEETWETVSAGTDREARRIRLELRRQAREAKEALSVRPEWTIAAPAPLDAMLRVTRADFEDFIRPRIDETLDELERTIRDAGTTVDELAGIYLAGGSSRIPLVQRMVTERFGPKVQMLDEPKTVVARGAAMADATELADLATHEQVRAEVASAHLAAHAPADQGTPIDRSEGAGGEKRGGTKRPILLGAVAIVLAAIVVGVIVLATHHSTSGGRAAALTTHHAPPATSAHKSTTTTSNTAALAPHRVCNEALCLTTAQGWTENSQLSDTAAIVLDHAGHPDESVKIGYLQASASQNASQVVSEILIPTRLQVQGATSSSCSTAVTVGDNNMIAKGFVCYPRTTAPHILQMTYYVAFKSPIDNPDVLVLDLTDDALLTQKDSEDVNVAKMYSSVTPATTTSTTAVTA